MRSWPVPSEHACAHVSLPLQFPPIRQRTQPLSARNQTAKFPSPRLLLEFLRHPASVDACIHGAGMCDERERHALIMAYTTSSGGTEFRHAPGRNGSRKSGPESDRLRRQAVFRFPFVRIPKSSGVTDSMTWVVAGLRRVVHLSRTRASHKPCISASLPAWQGDRSAETLPSS